MAITTSQAQNAKAAQAPLPTVLPPGQATLDKLSADDQALLDQLLTEPVEYIDHPDFANPDIESTLFGGEAVFEGDEPTRFVPPPAVAVRTRSSARVPTLSHDQEQKLFMRYNYARKQIVAILENQANRRLTAAQTRRLLAWGTRALNARTTIVRLNMPLVLAMAKRTRLTNIDFNELISEGNMALLRSVEKFDSSRGFKFSTYSCRAILKSFSRVAMRASRYRGYFPTEFDPAMERSDYIEQRRGEVEKDCVDELKEILLKNLAELSEVERTVIRERFAVGHSALGDENQPKTLEQVGHIIGVTKERVRQIQNKALKKIRHALEERYLAA